jgi:hypothetical protein
MSHAGIRPDRQQGNVMSEAPLRLTDRQIALFHEQGFLRLERVVVAEEIAWVREVYDRLFADRPSLAFGGPEFPEMMRRTRNDPSNRQHGQENNSGRHS